MAKYVIDSSTLNGIADAITEKTETNDGYKPEDMAAAIRSITGRDSGMKFATATAKLSSNGTSITFSNLLGTPKAFAIQAAAQISQSSTRYVASVISDGAALYGNYCYRSSSSAYLYYSASYFSMTATGTSLTVKTSSASNGGYFSSSVSYRLLYIY